MNRSYDEIRKAWRSGFWISREEEAILRRETSEFKCSPAAKGKTKRKKP